LFCQSVRVTFSVVVLAGGRSRRFGRDKLKLDWRGEALRDHVVGRMVEMSDDVVVLVAHDATNGDSRGRGGVRFISDHDEWPGPLVALAAALNQVTNDVALVVAADMPVVPMSVLELVATTVETSGAPVVGLALDGVIEPLPIGVRAVAVADELRPAVSRGERRLGAIARLPGAVAIAEPEWRRLDPNGDALRDIDTLDDLYALLSEPTTD
jgi:molybdopterin-guanine dinucleotide biosynthesis protein A